MNLTIQAMLEGDWLDIADPGTGTSDIESTSQRSSGIRRQTKKQGRQFHYYRYADFWFFQTG